MDTEHTPVETPIKTPVRVPNISQRPTPIKAPPVIAAPAVVTTRSGRVICPAKKLSLPGIDFELCLRGGSRNFYGGGGPRVGNLGYRIGGRKPPWGGCGRG